MAQRAYHPTWLNLIERWFELLRNIRICGVHAADKVEQALKGFSEATDDTLLATNPKRLSLTKPADEILASIPRFAGATKQIHGSSFMQDNNDSPQQNSSHHPKIAGLSCLWISLHLERGIPGRIYRNPR